MGLDEAWEIAYDMQEAGKTPPRTLQANASRTEKRWLKADLVEIALEKMDLSKFQKKSGKLNTRAVAREIQAELVSRNEALDDNSERKLTGLGLRTIELLIKQWDESENT